jgi:hypothetical protein
VLHYFRVELGREEVTVTEFTDALGGILKGFGLHVETQVEPEKKVTEPVVPVASPSVVALEVDLLTVEKSSGGGGELLFFHHLQADLANRVRSGQANITYRRLRECSMALCSAKRWTSRCQSLSDQIVDYLRTCLKLQGNPSRCVLCIR